MVQDWSYPQIASLLCIYSINRNKKQFSITESQKTGLSSHSPSQHLHRKEQEQNIDHTSRGVRALRWPLKELLVWCLCCQFLCQERGWWSHPALYLPVGLKLASGHSSGSFTFPVPSAGRFQTRKHQAWEDAGIWTLRSLSGSILSRDKKTDKTIAKRINQACLPKALINYRAQHLKLKELLSVECSHFSKQDKQSSKAGSSGSR